MPMRSFKDALAQTPQLGFCSMYNSPGIIERIGPDWDWCWIDAQHGEWGPHDAVTAVRACDLAGIFSLVRAPGHDPATIGRILDTACHAVMIPMVQDAQQAEAVAYASRFAPHGGRSFGARRLIDLYGRSYAHADQAQPLIVCQIESPGAVERAEAIAAVDGVDALFFGPDDMALARGLAMDRPRPAGCFDQEMAAVAEAARKHGKIPAGIFATPEAVKKGVELGYRLIICSGDVNLLATHSKAAAEPCRAALGAPGAGAAPQAGSLY